MSYSNLIHRVILKTVLGWLSEEIRELQAIMFIGRGDHAPEYFTKALEALLADGLEKLNPARMV